MDVCTIRWTWLDSSDRWFPTHILPPLITSRNPRAPFLTILPAYSPPHRSHAPKHVALPHLPPAHARRHSRCAFTLFGRCRFFYQHAAGGVEVQTWALQRRERGERVGCIRIDAVRGAARKMWLPLIFLIGGRAARASVARRAARTTHILATPLPLASAASLPLVPSRRDPLSGALYFRRVRRASPRGATRFHHHYSDVLRNRTARRGSACIWRHDSGWTIALLFRS